MNDVLEKKHKSTAQISWEKIHNLINSSIDSTVSSAEEKRILKERAERLSIEPEERIIEGTLLGIVIFRLSNETYAIESSFIQEVQPLKDFTYIPGVPAFILGIVNIRGRIISIVDLKKFFNLDEKGLGQLNLLIIIKNEKMELGILADDIIGISSVPLDTIKAVPSGISGIGKEYLRGVTKEHMIVLNAENILNDQKIIINQE